MSSADPPWPPPAGYPRPRRLAWVLAVLLPLVLLLGLAAPLGVALGIARLRVPATDPPATVPGSGAADEGQPGVGDPYFPSYGSSGYDALKYTIDLRFDVHREALTANTVISARATQTLRSFYFDLALTTDRVLVNGQPAAFSKSGFSDVRVTPTSPIASGATFEVSVDYSGRPGRLKQGSLTAWYATGQEWTAAGEPESSAWWFPADDHPSDPALMDVSVRVPAGMEAISVGRLESVTHGRAEPDGAGEALDTWRWVSDQALATYVSFLSIGQYALQQGVVDGRPYVYAVSEQLSRGDRQRAFAALQQSGAIVRELESLFGPYPFTELGGIVVAHKLWFDGLEAQTRPVYERRSITGDSATGLVAHELAHMWFGDNVTLRRWDDIFTNEAYASWAQWGYTERTGGPSANDALNATYQRARDRPAFWRVTMIDPGKQHLFDAVYARGPMTLQALRNVMGDKAFFDLARDWSHQRGSRSLEEWMVAAQSRTRVDLLPFFQAWLYSPTVPDRTAANGFRG
jgi:aminopeptidase N